MTSDIDEALRIALDADRAERERVSHLSRLRARPYGRETALALVPLLNEPLDGLAREVFALLAARHAPHLTVGVDARGLLAPSPTPLDDLVADGSGFVRVCPVLGPVVTVRHATLLLPHLAEQPPWARQGANGAAWLRRLDRRPLLHLLSDDTTRSIPLHRGGDGLLHAHTPLDRHVRMPLVQLALRGGRVIVAHTSLEEEITIDAAPLVRTTELRPGQVLGVAGAPVLEIAALAPTDGTDVDGGLEGPA